MSDTGREFHAADVSIAIPTYGREQVLLDTIAACLALDLPAGEILIIDQTPSHEPQTEATLRRWVESGQIRLLRRDAPSLPAAMNHALCEARNPIVLSIDDDVELEPDLVDRHARAHGRPDVWAVVGQVLQPGEVPIVWEPTTARNSLRQDLDFRFNSSHPCYVRNCMSGNLSVRREEALTIGGFDENFSLTVAFRYETDFARRIWEQGGKIMFEPAASLRHLRASRGGTRTAAQDHLRSPRPDHSIGDYYFALRHGTRRESAAYIAKRFVRSVTTRFHLRHPWWIPSRLVGEFRGFLGARGLARQKPRLLEQPRIAEAVRAGRAACK